MPRKLALKILKEIFEEGAYADLAVKHGLEKSTLERRDKALATNIAYGTVQHLRFIDYQLSAYSQRPIESLTPCIRDILRMAVYQICFMDRIPDNAAVNEAVKLAKKNAFSASSYVNGVLRNFLRGGRVYPKSLKGRLSVMYSFPDWLVDLWLSEYGALEGEKLLAACNAVAPLSVRINPLKASVEEVEAVCKAERTAVPCGLLINEPSNIAETAMFKEGLLSVQDIGAQMAGLMLAPEPGDAVLDVCAAPGGKTTHMAELMENEGRIDAWDIHAHKVELIRKNAERLGISIINASCHDARKLDESLLASYDKIMVDVPCSGLGIIRKKPDIKWQRTMEDAESLAITQSTILEVSSYYLKSGGELLYCTCTINKKENEAIVEAFLEKHPEFSLADEPRQLLPHKDNTDGFFFAKLRKR